SPTPNARSTRALSPTPRGPRPARVASPRSWTVWATDGPGPWDSRQLTTARPSRSDVSVRQRQLRRPTGPSVRLHAPAGRLRRVVGPSVHLHAPAGRDAARRGVRIEAARCGGR